MRYASGLGIPGLPSTPSETLEDIETVCECVPDSPAYYPGAAGFPGWLIPERSGFAVGNFAISLGNTSTGGNTTASISTNNSTTAPAWGSDPNLYNYLNHDGDFVLLLRGSRVLVGISGGTPNQAAADLQAIAVGGYLAHTPSGGLERRIRHLQSTYSVAWGEGGGLEAAADFGTARADARDNWSRPSWPIVRPINMKNDSLSFLLPQTQVARAVVLELDAIAINVSALPIPYVNKKWGARAIADFLTRHYPPLGYLAAFKALATKGR